MHRRTLTHSLISSLGHDWCRQCICDIKPVAFAVFASVLFQIFISFCLLRLFVSLCVCLCVCVYIYVCVCVCVYICVCVCLCLQRDCLDTAFSCLTELSGILQYGKKTKNRAYAWARTCIHLVTPLPLASSRLTPSLTRADSWAKCVRATMPPRQHPCDFDFLLSHFEYNFKVTVENFPLHCLKDLNWLPPIFSHLTAELLLFQFYTKKKSNFFFYQALPCMCYFLCGSICCSLQWDLCFIDLTHILNLEAVVN